MANTQSISICSHNIHGFADKKEFLNSRCQANPLLFQCIQEHWLPPPFKKRAGTNALRSVHPDFEGFATSAMKNAEENGIRRGRGFGGTGFLYPKSFSNVIKPLIKFNNERVSVMELKCYNFDLVIINVYMPFLDRSDLQSAIGQYDETIGFIEYIISEKPESQFIILGDLNCNIFNPTHPFSASLNSFIHSHNLVCTFSQMESFDVDSTFTRHDSRSRSLLDYIFVSQGIKDCVTNVSIGQYHDNHSDHLPVEIELSLQIRNITDSGNGCSNNSSSILWSKLSSNELEHFSVTMETALDLIEIPSSVLHGHQLCTDDSHKFDLEMYFSSIIDCISLADSVIKRSCVRALKPF